MPQKTVAMTPARMTPSLYPLSVAGCSTPNDVRLAVAMMVFLMALAGIPPFGGWWAKFAVFKALVDAETFGGYSLAVIAAVNSVVALFYYLNVLRTMWADDAPDGDVAPIRVPASLATAMALTAIATIAFGVYPQFVNDVTDVTLLGAGG